MLKVTSDQHGGGEDSESLISAPRHTSPVTRHLPYLGRWRRASARSSESETIVFGVGADPEPCDDFAFANAESAMMVADSDDTDAVPSFLESQGGMERFAPSERVFRARESLDRGG